MKYSTKSPPVLEGIHDVGELVCVAEPERVANLVNARQIDDGVAQQRVEAGLPGDVSAEGGRVGPDVDRGPALAAES